MIVDVYDLMSTLCCSRYKVDTVTSDYILLERKRLSDVLIWPDSSKNRNQPPYIQERKRPILRDLVGESGEFCYKHCFILSDFLQMEHQDAKKIEAYFRALRSSSYAFDRSADRNVILIPDNFDSSLQEKILRSCALPRSTTSLLWRSVATCLGNLSLIKQLANKDEQVKIIDCQQRYRDESVLNLINEGHTLVPQRRAYKKGPYYPCHNEYNGGDVFLPANEFYRYTYFGSFKDCVVWNPGERQFEKKNFVRARKIKLYIELGGCKTEVNRFSVSDGAALYVARKVCGKSTYYDECTGLYIVVQDLEREEIYAKELIAPNAKCSGGEEITGTVNTDCFIDKGADSVRFRLVDAYGDDVPLKVLDYDFKMGAMKKREPLELHPSMIPGQGIARVRVIGESQLREEVELDLLEMTEPDPPETVNSLRSSIKHSYPVAIPAVAADAKLWHKALPDVNRYMKDRKYRKQEMFSYCGYANPQSSDVQDRLNRINVFGYAENRQLPVYAGSFDFESLFDYMAKDYSFCIKRGDTYGAYSVLSMISRTYQGGNIVFSPIKCDVLRQVEVCSWAENASINPHVMTACANLLRTQDELKRFFGAYVRKLSNIIRHYGRRKTDVPLFKGSQHWDRAMCELLIANNGMLENISTDDCNHCMENLITLLPSYYYQEKPRLCFGVLKVILFLLMRRRYDKSFLKEGCKLRQNAEAALTILKQLMPKANSSDAQRVQELSNIVLKYVQGKGTLDDLIVAVETD